MDLMKCLQQLADGLNRLPRLETRVKRPDQRRRLARNYALWRAAQSLVSSPDPKVRRRFNRLAARNPVIVRMSKDGTMQLVDSRQTSPVVGLLAFFFTAQGSDRLRRCEQCARWFVDRGRNKAARRCSERCTWAWWSRSRRRAAGHREPPRDEWRRYDQER